MTLKYSIACSSSHFFQTQKSKEQEGNCLSTFLTKNSFFNFSFMLNCVNAAHATHILGKGNLYRNEIMCILLMMPMMNHHWLRWKKFCDLCACVRFTSNYWKWEILRENGNFDKIGRILEVSSIQDGEEMSNH